MNVRTRSNSLNIFRTAPLVGAALIAILCCGGCAPLLDSNVVREEASRGGGRVEVIKTDPPQGANAVETLPEKNSSAQQPNSAPASTGARNAPAAPHAALAQNQATVENSAAAATGALPVQAALTQAVSPPLAVAAARPGSPLPAAAQAEYLRALDRAGVTEPTERADMLAAIEATDPAYRAILLRTLRANRGGNDPGATATTPQRRQKPPAFVTHANPFSSQTPAQLPSIDIPDYADLTESGNRVVMHVEPVEEEAADDPATAFATPRNDLPKPKQARGAVAQSKASPNATNVKAAKAANASSANSVTVNHQDAISSDALDAAIADLETRLTQLESGAAAQAEEMRLRLLRALAGRREDALEPIAGLSAAQQDFLSHQVYALLALMPRDPQTPLARRSAIAAEHIRTAAERLGQSTGLTVKNPHFCTEIKGFGAFTPFAKATFRQGQEALLYAELENFASETAERGEHTKFTARYQILDASGNRVQEKELVAAEEFCRNRRRDYFVSYHLWLPQAINAGEYTLKLIVEDQIGGHYGESSVAFSIGEAVK